jgi:hypothetical protein
MDGLVNARAAVRAARRPSGQRATIGVVPSAKENASARLLWAWLLLLGIRLHAVRGGRPQCSLLAPIASESEIAAPPRHQMRTDAVGGSCLPHVSKRRLAWRSENDAAFVKDQCARPALTLPSSHGSDSTQAAAASRRGSACWRHAGAPSASRHHAITQQLPVIPIPNTAVLGISGPNTTWALAHQGRELKTRPAHDRRGPERATKRHRRGGLPGLRGLGLTTISMVPGAVIRPPPGVVRGSRRAST